MKEILIPLNFTNNPTVYDTLQSFSTSDEASGVLTFTTTADVAGTVASLTIRNASENANRQTVLIDRLDVNTSPFSYALKNPLPFGQYEGTVLLKKNLTVIASASFLFGVNSSLSAEVLPDLVKAYALDELVENVETEVSNLKEAFNLTVSETVKGVNKTESSLQAQENVRYLNEHQRKANELERIANEHARIAAEVERKDTFDTLVDSEVIEQTVVQEVAEKYQEIEALNAPEMVSFRQQLADVVKKGDLVADVRDFGAVGDYNHVTGIGTDNTQAFIATIASLPSTGGTLYVPVGNYLIPDGGIIIDKQISIIGDSSGTYDDGGSRIFTLSPTANLFTCTKGGSVVVGIAFVNASPTRPTAGSALLCTDFDWGRIDRCLFRDFWNNVQVDSGYFYSIRDSAFLAPVNYGCYMRNIAPLQHDHGDQVLEGCNFSKYGDPIDGGTAVRWESGGGLRFVGCKVNAGTQPGYTDTGFFENGFVTVMQPGGTSVHTITGCSIEGWLNHGISVSGVANATFGKISIVGNEFLASGSGGACVHADGKNMDSLDNLVITGNVGYGYSGGVMLYDLSKAVVTGNNFADCVQAGMTIANVTDLIQSDNLFKTSVWDLDASNFASAKAGHRRKSWEWGHDVYNNVGTFLAGKICPGEYAEIIVSVKVYGNVSAVGGFIMEQKRAVARVLNNAIVTQTIGTDIAVGAGAAEIAITYDVDTSPTYVVPKITTINGKSFTGAVEVSVDGAVYAIYYQ